MQSTGKTETVISSSGPLITRVKGLFPLLTELQIISEGEKKAGDYNPEIVTPYSTRISFTTEGMHAVFYTSLFTFLTLPLIIGVLNNYLPAFGKYEHDRIEKLILLALTFSPGAVKLLFTAWIIFGLYLGRTTKIIVDWFLIGVVSTIGLVLIFGTIIYLITYSVFLGLPNMYKLFVYCVYQHGTPFWIWLFKVIYGIKMSIPKAMIYFWGYGLIEIFVLALAYYYALKKTKKRKELLRKYEIEIESP